MAHSKFDLLRQRPHWSVITVRRQESEATLTVGAGRLISARCGGLEGEAALAYVLTWSEGRFRVVEGEDA